MQSVLPQERLDKILQKYGAERQNTPEEYRIVLNGSPVSLLVSGADLFATNCSTFLVGFSGAVVDAANKKPPYFAGRGISRELGVPLISFSDPTMERDAALSLGFHAGHAQLPNLPAAMAQVIQDLTAAFSANAILFGGSGGGFAALNTLRYCSGDDIALVWNPQTHITRYYRPAALAYIAAAFPELAPKNNLDSPDATKALEADLEKAGCPFRVAPWQGGGTVIYCQNQSDRHHVIHHFRPFFAQSTPERIHGDSFKASPGQGYIYLGAWGQGHVLLPRAILIGLLRGLLAKQETASLMRDISKKHDRPDDRIVLAGDLGSEDIALSFSTQGPEVVATAALKGNLAQHFEFAFYLFSGQDRIKARFYSQDPVFRFEPKGANLRVRVFVRDIAGGKTSTLFPYRS